MQFIPATATKIFYNFLIKLHKIPWIQGPRFLVMEFKIGKSMMVSYNSETQTYEPLNSELINTIADADISECHRKLLEQFANNETAVLREQIQRLYRPFVIKAKK